MHAAEMRACALRDLRAAMVRGAFGVLWNRVYRSAHAWVSAQGGGCVSGRVGRGVGGELNQLEFLLRGKVVAIVAVAIEKLDDGHGSRDGVSCLREHDGACVATRGRSSRRGWAARFEESGDSRQRRGVTWGVCTVTQWRRSRRRQTSTQGSTRQPRQWTSSSATARMEDIRPGLKTTYLKYTVSGMRYRASALDQKGEIQSA